MNPKPKAGDALNPSGSLTRRGVLVGLAGAGFGSCVEARAFIARPGDPQHRVGRFAFRLPSAFQVEGRHHEMYRCVVDTLALDGQGADARWSAHTARLHGTLVRAYEPSPNVLAVLMRDAEDGFTVTASKAFADHLVVASRRGEGDALADIERLVRGVVAGYVPGARNGFHVGFGALTSVPGINEQARVTLRHRDLPGFTVSFETHTVREPERDPLRFIDDDLRSLPGHSLRLVVNQRLRAAGLVGAERRLEGPGLMRASWNFEGGAANPVWPAIMLVADASPAVERAVFDEAWAVATASLEAIPLAARPA